MIHKKVEQNTPEWYALRAGIPTASGFENIIQPKLLGYSASAVRYINHLIAERSVGHILEFQSAAMKEGHEREPEAREAFKMVTKLPVEDGGFFLMDDLRSGASPDGLILADGLWETKNPNADTHIGYDRVPGSLSANYRIQLQTQLIHSERDFVWIMSYYPELIDVTEKVHRDEKVIEKILECRKKFCDELDEAWEAHKTKHGIKESKWELDRKTLLA